MSVPILDNWNKFVERNVVKMHQGWKQSIENIKSADNKVDSSFYWSILELFHIVGTIVNYSHCDLIYID